MIKESLYIKTKTGGAFPNANMPARLGAFTYTAQRMGGAPTITATLSYPTCLDELWTREEYVEFRGEKYYIDQVPTSSKENSSVAYKHEITLVSERIKLENTYFLDVVTQDTEELYKDRVRSNNTDVKFYGNVHELCARINDSMKYSGLDYQIEIDSDVYSEDKEVSFESKYLTEAIQEIYSTFELPYYFSGKTIIVGRAEYTMGTNEALEYGADGGLLSITKTNANHRIVDRITGCGGDKNIPYYYPNESPSGTAIFSTENFAKNLVNNIDMAKLFKVNANFATRYELVQKVSPSAFSTEFTCTPSFTNTKKFTNEYTDEDGDGVDDVTGKEINSLEVLKEYDKAKNFTETVWSQRVYCLKGEEFQLVDTFFDYNIEYKIAYRTVYYSRDESKSVSGTKPLSLQIWDGNDKAEDSSVLRTEKGYKILSEGWYYLHLSLQWASTPILANDGERGVVDEISMVTTSKGSTLKIKRLYPGETVKRSWKFGDKECYADKIGFDINPENLNYLPAHTKTVTFNSTTGVWNETLTENPNAAAIIITGRNWVEPCTKLFPTIYRTTSGAERFYNAENNKYSDGEGGYLEFVNLHTAGNQHEYKQDFEDIYPTIKDMRNDVAAEVGANGKYKYEADAEYDDINEQISGLKQKMAVIADVAFDDNDNDEVDDDGKYLHPYFYIKLRKFSGTRGFSLFDHASVDEKGVINMTSGPCASCTFVIHTENLKNPVHLTSTGALVSGDYTDKMSANNLTESNQDTSQNEVWICVKKDSSTFGIVMPNAANKYYPKAGDTFVITGIDFPVEYLYDAEDRLEKELINYMYENNDEKFTFSIKFSRIFTAEHDTLMGNINENSILAVKYNGQTYLLFVQSYSIKADDKCLYEVTVELSEDLTQSGGALRNAISAATTQVQRNLTAEILKRSAHLLRKDIVDQVKAKTQFEEGLAIGTSEKENNDDYGFTRTAIAKVRSMNVVETDDEGETQSTDISSSGVKTQTVEATTLKSPEFSPYDEEILGAGYLLEQKSNGISSLAIDELLVRRKAVFAELEVRKISHTGGMNIYSPACSTIKRVTLTKNSNNVNVYRCYMLADDGKTTTLNTWKVGDLARCQAFNVSSGTSQNVSNKFYWRKVVGTGTFDSEMYVDLSVSDCATGSVAPQSNDVISLLGHVRQTGESVDDANERANAIIISSINGGVFGLYYKSKEVKAPFIAQMKSITSYGWNDSNFDTIESRDFNVFNGSFVVKDSSGENKSVKVEVKARDYYFITTTTLVAPAVDASGWKSTVQTPTKSSPYLWKKTVFHYHDGDESIVEYSDQYIAGMDGKGVNPNLLLDTIFAQPDESWEANTSGTMTETSYGGYKALKFVGYGDTDDLLTQTVRLDPNKTYTLSFYGKSSTNSSLRVYCSDDCFDKVKELNATWSLNSFTFQPQGEECTIAFQVYEDNAVYEICMIKLEEGSVVTSYIPHANDLKGATGDKGADGIGSFSVDFSNTSGSIGLDASTKKPLANKARFSTNIYCKYGTTALKPTNVSFVITKVGGSSNTFTIDTPVDDEGLIQENTSYDAAFLYDSTKQCGVLDIDFKTGVAYSSGDRFHIVFKGTLTNGTSSSTIEKSVDILLTAGGAKGDDGEPTHSLVVVNNNITNLQPVHSSKSNATDWFQLTSSAQCVIGGRKGTSTCPLSITSVKVNGYEYTTTSNNDTIGEISTVTGGVAFSLKQIPNSGKSYPKFNQTTGVSDTMYLPVTSGEIVFAGKVDGVDCTLTIPYTVDFAAKFSELSLTEDGFRIAIGTLQSNDEDLDTKIGTIDAKADAINLNIKNGLTNTGIDIVNKKITLKADNVDVQGTNGDVIALFNGQGVSSKAVMCYDGDVLLTSLNRFTKGELVQYWATGNKKLEIVDGNIRYYNPNGTLKWQIGDNGAIEGQTNDDWTTVTLYTLNNKTFTAHTFYLFTAGTASVYASGDGKYFTTQTANANNLANSSIYYTTQSNFVTAMASESMSNAKYMVRFFKFTNGNKTDTVTYYYDANKNRIYTSDRDLDITE